MKKNQKKEGLYLSLFCFVLAGLVYYFLPTNNMWKYILIGMFTLGGFGSIFETFSKKK